MAQAPANDQAIVQYGPYGSKARENYRWHLSANERITEVLVNHYDYVDAIGFKVIRPDGTTYTVRFGGKNSKHSKIVLKSGEYPTGFGGKYGKIRGLNKICIVSLKVYTNLCAKGYGPYGHEKLADNVQDFESPLQNGYPLVGVFGAQDGIVLESLGVMLMEVQTILQYGPYGSMLPETYRWQLSDSERITQIIINHGNVVDAIGFLIAKPDGTTYSKRFGGITPNPSIIVLKSGEYPTGFSGQYGYDNDHNQVGIAKIKVYTNLNPQGYGPYGLAEDVDNITNFESPLQYGWPLVGVFGASNDTLESVGVFLKKVLSSS
ncbi:unnamed protein product [Amaranthus hypochondriacus]